MRSATPRRRAAPASLLAAAAACFCLPVVAIRPEAAADGERISTKELTDAVGADDQCVAREAGGCALNALQVQRVTQSGSASGTQSSRRRKSQAEDLSIAWEKKVYAWTSWLHKNITMMEWKMYYYKMDMNSTNNSVFDVQGLKGVNGTKVDWNRHPATWVPTFGPSLVQENGAAADETADEAADEADVGVDLLGGATREGVDAGGERDGSSYAYGRPRRNSQHGVPPRKKRMQALMGKEQDRLNDMWSELTYQKRMLNWMGNYMGSHRRLYHGRPVFAQEAASVAEHAVHRPHEEQDFSTEPEPQTELVKQIESAVNQTEDLWVETRRLGGMIEAMKRRAHRYRHGKAVN